MTTPTPAARTRAQRDARVNARDLRRNGRVRTPCCELESSWNRRRRTCCPRALAAAPSRGQMADQAAAPAAADVKYILVVRISLADALSTPQRRLREKPRRRASITAV